VTDRLRIAEWANLLGIFNASLLPERMPRGWSCAVEARVLDGRFEQLMGYAPQADVLLASNDGRFRL